MPVNAVKQLGNEQVTRVFSDESWKSGVPAKNGWKQLDYSTIAIATKLPEVKEVNERKVETVDPPAMPPVGVDEELELLPRFEESLKGENSVEELEVIDPVKEQVVVKNKRGPKKKVNA